MTEYLLIYKMWQEIVNYIILYNTLDKTNNSLTTKAKVILPLTKPIYNKKKSIYKMLLIEKIWLISIKKYQIRVKLQKCHKLST